MLRIMPNGGLPTMPPTQPDQPASPSDQPTDQPIKKTSADRVDPSIAGYMGPEMGPFMCSRCDFFAEPNACHIVSGPIAPDGCCNLFTPMDTGSEEQGGEGSPEEEAGESPDEESDEQGEGTPVA